MLDARKYPFPVFLILSGGIHNCRKGAQRRGLAPENSLAQRADLKAHIRRLVCFFRRKAALWPGYNGHGRKIARECRRQGMGLLVFIEEQRPIRLGRQFQRLGIGICRKYRGDSTAPRLLRRRSGDFLPPGELFLQAFYHVLF